MKKLLLLICSFILLYQAQSQRLYTNQSVLASGNWYQFSVDKAGIYKLDLSFLSSLGINATGMPSQNFRLFGNGGAMLPEANNVPRPDDLLENAIAIVDGGDGVLNGSDYILFYSPGPHHWVRDSSKGNYQHQFNLYTNKTYYYLNTGLPGKRVSTASVLPPATRTVSSYDYRYFYELDSVNFLSSGKKWYGEEFADAPGKKTVHQFKIPLLNQVAGEPLTVEANLVSRSTGAQSVFDTRINGQSVHQTSIPVIGTGVTDLFAREKAFTATTIVPGDSLTISFHYQPGNFNAQGWLDWFRIFCRAKLEMPANGQLFFRDLQSVGVSSSNFSITESRGGLVVWDITDPLNPVNLPVNKQGNSSSVTTGTVVLKEFIASYSDRLLTPVAVGKIANQNLHQAPPVQYLVITHETLLAEAERLATFHRQHQNLSVRVIPVGQIYNEFASGNPDPTSIRDFVKMYHDKYAGTPDSLQYLLLMGDGSFDYKSRLFNNTNLVPAYQSLASLDPLATYVSDDYFGFLDDAEDINSGLRINLLDVGIGRIPAMNATQAKNYVDKLIAYHAKESFGPWRNQHTFIADDEDMNLHLDDSEKITNVARQTNPLFTQHKIYLDAYRQESSPGGESYPQVNAAINNQVLNGTLIWNYNGHGGPYRLAEETIVDKKSVSTWQNANKLPLFITATCDFAPYDNPAIASIGEDLLLQPKTGGIALMTTTRVVFAYSNRIMNQNYLDIALKPVTAKRYRSLGNAVREAKNFTYQTSGDVTNNLKFTLLGDPALTLAFPQMNVAVTNINGFDPATIADTLKATDKVSISGLVNDANGNQLPSFNGTLYLTVFDKPKMVQTLANDPGSLPVSFETRQNILYKGKASVTNGRWQVNFKMPKDIQYNFGNGSISLYADDGNTDANGLESNFVVGGIGTQSGNDTEGPEIKAYLNDESFVNGSLTNNSPVLLLKLTDSSGINTTGTGIGHDLVATLDDDNRTYYILNDYYEAALNSYQKGTVKFQLPELTPGPHTLKIKAWDVMNNSGEATLNFVVGNDEKLQVTNVLNYPNPFSTHTQFWFTHNQPGRDLQVTIQIFSLGGRLIKTLKSTINTIGNRSFELEWDARDDYGDKVGRGVYFYKLKVASGSLQKEVIEKLFIF